MQVKPVASPAQIQEAPSNAASAKARAIAAFNQAAQGQSQEAPVQDPTRVSPEEMTAISTTSAGQSDTVETEAPVVEETPKEAPKAEDTQLSKQFAQLARQEKALRAKQMQADQALKAREQALAAREAAIAAKDQEYSQGYVSKDRLKADALQVLAEAGLNYDELVQQVINGQTPSDPRVSSEIKALKAELAAIKAQNEDSKKSYANQQAEQYQAAVKQIQLDTKALVNSDPAFETIKATNSIRDVVDLITQTYDKDGILLSVEEAAQQVEDYLVEEAMKFTKIDKIKKRLAENASKSQQQAKAQTPAKPAQQPQTMKTLTNASSSTRQLSAKERAILAFKGELKS